MKKQIANIITSCRILGSIGLLFCPVYSACFYGLYIFCGLTDMVDGTIARKTHAASEFGARLDTIADFLFVIASFAKLVPVIRIPVWIWGWAAVIAVVKLVNLVWGSTQMKQMPSIATDDFLCGTAVYSSCGVHHCNNSGNSGRVLYCNRPS